MPEITQKDLDRLLRAEMLLLALQECGVDNWEGYSDAISIAFPEEDAEEDAE